MAVKRYNGSGWDTVAGVGAQGPTGADGTAPLTTKGDLLTFGTSATRLAVGSNGDTLVADSAASTGLRWQATKSTQNAIINGAFDIWQRGTSFTATNVYSADRWYTYNAGADCTWSRQTGSGEFQYVMRVARNNGSTNTGRRDIWYSSAIEEATQFAGKTVTLSFWAKAGANYSAASNALVLAVYSGTGSTDVNRVNTAYTGDATVINDQSFTLTTTLTRYSVTFTLGSTVTQFAAGWKFTPVGTAGANDWFEITGVQFEVGSVATTFRRSGGTLQGELAACQRYYWRAADAAVTANHLLMNANAYTTTDCRGVVQFPVTMRTTPTLVQSSGTNYFNFQAATGDSFDSLLITLSTPTNTMVYAGSGEGVNGLVAGQAGTVFTNNAAAWVAFSAEL